MSEWIICPTVDAEAMAARQSAQTGRPVVYSYVPANKPNVERAVFLTEMARTQRSLQDCFFAARELWDRFCGLDIDGASVRAWLQMSNTDFLSLIECQAITSLAHYVMHIDLVDQFVARHDVISLVMAARTPSETVFAWQAAAAKHGIPFEFLPSNWRKRRVVLLDVGSPLAMLHNHRLRARLLHYLSRPASVLAHTRWSASRVAAHDPKTVWIEVPNDKMARNQLPVAKALAEMGVPVGFLLTGDFHASGSWINEHSCVRVDEVVGPVGLSGYLRSLFRLVGTGWAMSRRLNGRAFVGALQTRMAEHAAMFQLVLDQMWAQFGLGSVAYESSIETSFKQMGLKNLVMSDERLPRDRRIIAAVHRSGGKVASLQFGQLYRTGLFGPTPVDKFLACGSHIAGQFSDPARPGIVECVGFVETDELFHLLQQRDTIRDRIVARFGLDGGRPVVLMALSPLKSTAAPEKLEDILRIVARVVVEASASLLVKLHPAEWQGEVYVRVLAEFPDLAYAVVRSEISPNEVVLCGDIHVTNGSTVGVGMLLSGRPFIDIPLTESYAEDSYVGWGVALRADRPDMFEQALTRSINYPASVTTETASAREKFIAERLTAFDGQRASTAAAKIQQFFENPGH